ncbi:MAG: HAD-IC family P-type ATPase [Aquificota bacterium]|nr:HAD-IC family P-type ATPase [Aquificota bacterium]
MDVLVSVGTTGAYLYSLFTLLNLVPGDPFFETNAFLITFVRAGRFIEERARRGAISLLKSILSSQNSEVTVLEDGRELKKNVREVFKGEVVVCKGGDIVPLDGTVIRGQAYVSEAILTGEPEPVPKQEGDRVLSGSVVEEGYIEIRVEASYEGSYISKIVRMVDSALLEKPKVQRLADRVSHYFVQVVLLISALTFFLWIKLGGSLEQAVQFSLAVLVISCPCALGIATPLAIVVGISRALSKGILIKKPSSLELLSKIDILVFDKTGTLTEGRFKVVKCDIKSPEALDIALTMEARSNHPVAKAIKEYALKQGAKEVEARGMQRADREGYRVRRLFHRRL